MVGLKIHHYGLATNGLEKTADTLRSLGYQVGEVTVDPVQKVRIAFASRPPEPMIEIISDIDASGPTKGFISKAGNGLYHICYEVDNLEEAVIKLRGQGYLTKQHPVPAAAFHGNRIAWMYNRYIGLIELLEKS